VGQQGEPAEHPQHRQVGESYRHEYRQCPTSSLPRSQMPDSALRSGPDNTRSTATTEFSALTGVTARQQREAAEHPDHEEVDEADEHESRA
jgi:hypothetical protein